MRIDKTPAEKQDEQTMMAYILQELSGEARIKCEARYYEDDDFFDQIRALEWELLRDLSRGELRGKRMELFQAVVDKSPDLQKELEAMRRIMTPAGRTRRGRGMAWLRLPVWNAAMVAATLTVAAVSGWQALDLRKTLISERAERSRERQEGRVQAASPMIVLFPGALRGPGQPMQIVPNPGRGGSVSFALPISKSDAPEYQVVLRNVDHGGAVWSGAVKQAPLSNSLSVSIPGSLLQRADYVFEVRPAGPGPTETFLFRITRD
jgi:hypothetical protein